jgi:hypothetical protein
MEQHECHDRPLHEEFADVRLADFGPVHEGVFAEAEEGHEDVEFVLVGC